MRTYLLITSLTLVFTSLITDVKAQVGVDATVMYGYSFNDEFDVYDGYGEISDGGVFTGIIGFRLNPKYDIELYYSRQNVDFNFQYYYNSIFQRIDNEPASMNYLQIGGCRNQPLDAAGRTMFFGGVNLGAGFIVPESSKYDDIWKFAFGLKAGIKHFVSERVGIRIQTQLQVPVLYTSGSIWVGTGGTSVGMSAGSTITQFGFSGGLIFRLK